MLLLGAVLKKEPQRLRGEDSILLPGTMLAGTFEVLLEGRGRVLELEYFFVSTSALEDTLGGPHRSLVTVLSIIRCISFIHFSSRSEVV